jgi:hypothetical protein
VKLGEKVIISQFTDMLNGGLGRALSYLLFHYNKDKNNLILFMTSEDGKHDFEIILHKHGTRLPTQKDMKRSDEK